MSGHPLALARMAGRKLASRRLAAVLMAALVGLLVLERVGARERGLMPATTAVFALLLVNLALNLVQRARALRGHALLAEVPSALDRWPLRRAIPVGEKDALPAAARALERAGYRVRTSARGLAALRGASSVYGSLGFHASMILVAFAALLSLATRMHGSLFLGEGESFDGTRPAYASLDPRDLADEDLPRIAFRLADVEATYDGADNLLDASARLRLPDGSEELLRVNEPFRSEGASVRLVEYGLAPILVLRASGREPVSAVAKLFVLPPGRPDQATLDGVPIEVRMYPDWVEETEQPASRSRDLVRPVALVSAGGGPEIRIDGGAPPVELEEGVALSMPHVLMWARLEVDRDRGRPVFFFGVLLAVGSLLWRLIVPERRVVAVIEGDTLVLAARADPTLLPFDFDRLARRIARELGPDSTRSAA